MANFNATVQTVPLGVNHGNQFYIYATIPAPGLALNDTLTVQVPTELAADSRPVSVFTYAPVAANVVAIDTDLTLTSHNVSTGATVLTAGGAVATGSHVIIGYIGAGVA